eukprot:SAG11_NODE_1655_length_4504_cov_31.952100_2_plen_63_part_00
MPRSSKRCVVIINIVVVADVVISNIIVVATIVSGYYVSLASPPYPPFKLGATGVGGAILMMV